MWKNDENGLDPHCQQVRVLVVPFDLFHFTSAWLASLEKRPSKSRGFSGEKLTFCFNFFARRKPPNFQTFDFESRNDFFSHFLCCYIILTGLAFQSDDGLRAVSATNKEQKEKWKKDGGLSGDDGGKDRDEERERWRWQWRGGRVGPAAVPVVPTEKWNKDKSCARESRMYATTGMNWIIL